MRRFFSRVALYFGLVDDGDAAPPPERLTPFGVFAVLFAGLIVGVLIEAVHSLGDSAFELVDALWRGALLGAASLIARIVEYRVRTRSTRRTDGIQRPQLPSD